ncbi:IQ and AAA domain-containing protein 1-like isoform X1 [Homalodisca vitripennis]|uniref:IQ and AAA domain-containing protein 1-like isoform X1 n=1 Tax=Homalodisca vitripennis TaxID=197043 RepID=UPI001EEA6F3C|nr:IQ and AAA domain-containing protein 1-like isoform X1 [Homalodisca vitripennis]
MSDRRYERIWREAEKELVQVVKDDKEYVDEDVIEDRQRAYRDASLNYIRYSMCANKLNICLDQMVHVDKRATIRTLLEATLSRLLQVKRELVNQDVSDFNYIDGALVDLKLTPYDVEIQVPRFYRRERAAKIQQVNTDIDRILEELATPSPTEDAEEGETPKEVDDKDEGKEKEEPMNKPGPNPKWPSLFKKVELTESEKIFKATILLIQRHERARVARLNTHKLKEKQRIQHEIAWQIFKPIPEDVQERSVILIQRFWRGYALRHKQLHHLTEGRLLMGELTPSWRPHDEEDYAREVEEERYLKTLAADEEHARDMVVLKEKVLRGDQDVKDAIADHLRWYIEDWYRKIGELPEFPEPTLVPEPEELLGFPKDTPSEFIKRLETKVTAVPTSKILVPGLPPGMIGGSAIIVANFWIAPALYELAHTAARLAKGKGGNKNQKKEKLNKQQLKELKEEEKEKKRLQKEAEQKELEEKLKRGAVPTPTDLLEPFDRHLIESSFKWKDYEDLEWNPTQRHRQDLPHISMTHERHLELREVVDELMRLEIEKLQAALDRDRGKKTKGDKKKKKRPRGKKGKKDPTADRTTESLFKELVENGIIKKTQDVSIDTFFCQPSWNSYDLRRDPWWQNPPPNLWDVKQVVKEYCILPLGSATVHRSAPLVRSVLLAGYPDCGKRTLVDAVVAETGSVLFDLSPTNTAGKYPGKKGLNMLVHLVTKMSRILQPSVIFLDGGEKPFYKKVPKTEKDDNPKLLKKQLPKMVKAVTPDDQVLFLATAENPWMGQANSLVKTYNKIIPMLPPDQSISAAYWHSQLMKYHGVERDFLYSPLAWCAQGYPLPTITQVLQEVLTAERVIALRNRPLDPQELLDVLLKIPPISEEQTKKLLEWYESTYPLAKTRAEKTKADAEFRERLAAIEAKKNEQKKKKK